MITDGIGRHEVLLPIHRNRYNFRENKCILFGERAFNTNVQNEKKCDRQRHCLMLQIRPFWKIPSLVG